MSKDKSQEFARRLEAILRPYVVPLDRDLWTFRYEERDSFAPSTVEDLIKRISAWADRFSNPEIASGSDTGPGVYVAMDPVATATWGGKNPRLFAIKIKRGVPVLIGDQYETPKDALKVLTTLSQEMGCGASPTSMKFDLGHAVGYFRMNQNQQCRSAIIEALKALSVKAVSYGFNSVPLEGCRTTGTAISIINSAAISLTELNRYSEDGNIEGQPSVTPYVRDLFHEAKSDYYSQSLLANLEVWDRYKNAYGFFRDVEKTDRHSYQTWKNESILKCGPTWSIETTNPEAVKNKSLRIQSDSRVKNILIEMSLIYRERFKNSADRPTNTPSELRVERIRKVLERTTRDRDTEIRLTTAQVPRLTGNAAQDEKEYLELLIDCLQKYKTQPFGETVLGECGIAPEH